MKTQTTELPTTCSHCGKQCAMIIHEYYEGALRKPTRRWFVIAPLYWLDNQSFCSADCATASVGMSASDSLKSEGASTVGA